MTTKEAIQRTSEFFPAAATKPDGPTGGNVDAALRCEKYVSQTELLELLEWIAVIVGKTHRVEITWELANVHKGERYYTLRVVVLSECVLSSENSSKKKKAQGETGKATVVARSARKRKLSNRAKRTCRCLNLASCRQCRTRTAARNKDRLKAGLRSGIIEIPPWVNPDPNSKRNKMCRCGECRICKRRACMQRLRAKRKQIFAAPISVEIDICSAYYSDVVRRVEVSAFRNHIKL